MREFVIGQNDANQRLDRFLQKCIPLLPASLLQKYIRLKRIKVNNTRTDRNYRLHSGDKIQCYINDEFFETPNEKNAYLAIATPTLKVIYEDENILLLDKPAGLIVHADEGEQINTLVNHMLAYLYQKREWNPKEENSFIPALCNRIDRNTGGIVIAAKNAEALRILNQKIRCREISKFYLCICIGTIVPPKGEINCFLRKDMTNHMVRVYHHPIPDGRSAITRYQTLQTHGELSLVEVELLTGRTHQIRASFSDLGHPLLGDGKYGFGNINRHYHETQQALYSYRLRFDFSTDSGILSYLKGREFIVDRVPFQEKYFA